VGGGGGQGVTGNGKRRNAHLLRVLDVVGKKTYTRNNALRQSKEAGRARAPQGSAGDTARRSARVMADMRKHTNCEVPHGNHASAFLCRAVAASAWARV